MVRNPPPDFRVDFCAFEFPQGTVPSRGELTFSADDLAHALFITGRAPGDRASYGQASVYEWLHRASMVPAYLDRTFHAGLVRSALALSLDRSESVAVSYLLGQAMTSIFCRTQLGVSHLLHIDRYSPKHHIRYYGTRRRADLFGLSVNGWVVAEAKGRSGNISPELRQTLETQKRSVSEIEGKPPWVALGCVAYFPRRAGHMHLDAFDPVKDIDEPAVFRVNPNDFLLSYYRPFLRLLEVDRRQLGDVFESVNFPNFGLRVALPVRLAERLRRAETGESDGLADDITEVLDDVHSRQIGVFPDGSVIETDWQRSIDAEGMRRFDL